MPILELGGFPANIRTFHSPEVQKGTTGRRKAGGLSDKWELSAVCLGLEVSDSERVPVLKLVPRANFWRALQNTAAAKACTVILEADFGWADERLRGHSTCAISGSQF